VKYALGFNIQVVKLLPENGPPKANEHEEDESDREWDQKVQDVHVI
jgi:hypothetical protein